MREKLVRYFPLTRLHIASNNLHPITSLPCAFAYSNSRNNSVVYTIDLLYCPLSNSLFCISILRFLLVNDADARIALCNLVELVVKVKDKSMELRVLIRSFDKSMLVLDTTVTGVLISTFDAAVVRSILLLSLCF